MGIECDAKLLGWKTVKRVLLNFFRCPGCGRPQQTINYGADGMAKCYSCGKGYHKDTFGTAKVQRYAAKCGKCGDEVSLTSANFAMNGTGWVCASCGNCVAVPYGNRIVNPQEVLSVQWNRAILTRGDAVGKNTSLVHMRTKRDLLVVRLLQAAAKEEDSRFLFCRENEQEAGVYLDKARRKYLGFIVWSEDGGHAVLRQIFIVPDERRKGLAEGLVRFWVTRYAEGVNETFGIEAPNEEAIALHLKLGHLISDGDLVKGLKCFFAPSM
jgi:GNAT superfamily N-acetyltransferase/ribosomal protein S27E